MTGQCPVPPDGNDGVLHFFHDLTKRFLGRLAGVGLRLGLVGEEDVDVFRDGPMEHIAEAVDDVEVREVERHLLPEGLRTT